jgi:basic membrane protein A
MIDVAPTTSLVSCRINWTPYMTGAVQALLEGKKIEKVVKSPYRGTDAAAGFNRDWIEIIGINRLILAEGTMEAVEKAVNQFKSGSFTVFKGNYSGVNPFDPDDVWDLRNAYIECEKRSAPSFCYILRDVITSD